jgi:hypothetical protein
MVYNAGDSNNYTGKIQVDPEVHEALVQEQRKGETLNDTIKRLLKEDSK